MNRMLIKQIFNISLQTCVTSIQASIKKRQFGAAVRAVHDGLLLGRPGRCVLCVVPVRDCRGGAGGSVERKEGGKRQGAKSRHGRLSDSHSGRGPLSIISVLALQEVLVAVGRSWSVLMCSSVAQSKSRQSLCPQLCVQAPPCHFHDLFAACCKLKQSRECMHAEAPDVPPQIPTFIKCMDRS